MSSEDAEFGFWFKDASSTYADYYVYAPNHVIAMASNALYKPLYVDEAKNFGPHVVGIFLKKNGLLINKTIDTVIPCWNENEDYWVNPCIKLDYNININNTNIILDLSFCLRGKKTFENHVE